MTDLEKLLELREKLNQENGYLSLDNPNWGICSNANVMDNITFELMRKWPKYSGDSVVPVPAPKAFRSEDNKEDNAAAYYKEAMAEEMWSSDYEYGRSRLALLDFLINELQK